MSVKKVEQIEKTFSVTNFRTCRAVLCGIFRFGSIAIFRKGNLYYNREHDGYKGTLSSKG